MKRFYFNYPLNIPEIQEKISKVVCDGLLYSQYISNGQISFMGRTGSEEVFLISSCNQYEAVMKKGDLKSSFIIEAHNLGETILGDRCYMDFKFKENIPFDPNIYNNRAQINVFYGSKLLKIDFYGHKLKKELWDDEEDKDESYPDYYVEADFIHTVLLHFDDNRYLEIGPNSFGADGMRLIYYNEQQYREHFVTKLDDIFIMNGIEKHTLIDSIEINAS